jgi:hypothetical protein
MVIIIAKVHREVQTIIKDHTKTTRENKVKKSIIIKVKNINIEKNRKLFIIYT